MRVCFATTSKKYSEILLDLGVKNILVSYLEKKLINIIKEHNVNLIIDSGAYSAWTRGVKIDIDEYISFCKSIEQDNKLNELYFINLDIIPGNFGHIPNEEDIEKAATKGWQNYEKMKASGLSVMHIFHQHEDFKWLHKLMNEDSDYIGISPANDLSRKKRLVWLRKVFNIVRDKKKTHGFGVTSSYILKNIPFYSADSTNWVTLVRYGLIMVHDKFKCRLLRYKRLEDALEIGLPYKCLSENKELVKELKKPILDTMRLEKDLNNLWKTRGL